MLLHSHRDQLSANVVAWWQGFELAYLDPKAALAEAIECPVLRGARVPRDFDDDRYRSPDLAGTSARRHYLERGAAEGRRYK